MNGILRIIISIPALTLMSCATISSDWEEAKKSNTIPEYEQFINKYKNNNTELRPYTSYVSAARMEINGINEPSDWLKAKESNSTESYEAYISQHPLNKNSKIAKQKIDDLNWANTKKESTLIDYYFFITNHPKSKYIKNAWQRIKKQLAPLKPINNKQISKIKNEIKKVVLPFKIEELYNESMKTSNEQSTLSIIGSGNGVSITTMRLAGRTVIQKTAYKNNSGSETKVVLQAKSQSNYISVFHTEKDSEEIKLRIFDPEHSNSNEINYTLVEFFNNHSEKGDIKQFFCRQNKCYDIHNLN